MVALPGYGVLASFYAWSIDALPIEPQHEISNNVVYATINGSYQPAHTRSLIRAIANR